jgi:hypothetical protein
MQSDEQQQVGQARISDSERVRRTIVADMTPAEIEEEGRITDEILQRIDRDWDMSAVPFSFYLHEKGPVRAERIASEREALARMLEGDPEEHRATWDALRAALEARYQRAEDTRASG